MTGAKRSSEKIHIAPGDLLRVEPACDRHPGWTTIWASDDPNDTLGDRIMEGSVVLVVGKLKWPYVPILGPTGVGWLHTADVQFCIVDT